MMTNIIIIRYIFFPPFHQPRAHHDQENGDRMIKQKLLLNSVIAKYHDLSVSPRSFAEAKGFGK